MTLADVADKKRTCYADKGIWLARPPGTGNKKVRSTFGVISASLIATALLSGCAALGGGSKPLDTYQLSAPDAGTTGNRRARLQLLITEPTALKALDGQNIVIEPQTGVIEYLAGAQWADRLPTIVQARLVETFQRSGRVGGVGTPGEGLAIDYRVIVDIRKFSIVSGGKSANVELNVRVLNDRNGVVRGTRTFAKTASAGGDGNDALVGALDRAFDEAALEILDWSLSVM